MKHFFIVNFSFIVVRILPVSEIFVPLRKEARQKHILIHTVCGEQPTESNTKLAVV